MIDEPCFECGQPADVRHHVVPLSLGGSKTVPLCIGCHKKAHGGHNFIQLSKTGSARRRRKPDVYLARRHPDAHYTGRGDEPQVQ